MTNWAIVGLGRIAHKFAQDLQKVEGARLWAVASTSQERAEEFAVKYGVRHAFGSYDLLLKCPDLHVVYVATPHPLHTPLALKYINAGLPVLIEKPWAMHTEEARRLALAARRQGVFAMEAMWTRFIPLFEKTIALIEAGEIGDVIGVKADFGFKAWPIDPNSRIFSPKLGGGSLLDIGIYPIFLALILLGRPEKIQAAATFTDLGVDESCAMTFIYPDKKLAMLHSSIAMTTATEAYIYGEKGNIYLHPRWHHPSKLTISRYDGKNLIDEKIELPYDGHGYSFEIKHVMDCLENGLTESPLLPLDFSLDLTEMLDWVREEFNRGGILE